MSLPLRLIIALTTLLAATSAPPSARAAPPRAQALAKTQPLTIGTTHVIRSRVLGEERVVNVILPPGYGKQPARRFPVLYLIDGGLDQDLLAVAGVAQSGALWGRSGDAILIGIATLDRRKELVGPTRDPALLKRYPTAGASAAFRKFIRTEVKPLVEARYRTNGHDVVVGESLAGLFIVETYLEEPGLFEGYAAIDPSLWWDKGALAQNAALRMRMSQGTPQLLIAVAKEQMDEHEPFDHLVTAVRSVGRPLCLLPRPDQTHATIYQQLIPSVLQYLLPPTTPAPPEFGFTVPCRTP